MNQTELNRDWIAENAVLAFVGALLVAPTLQPSQETYQLPFLSVELTVSNLLPLAIAIFLFLASFLLVLAYFFSPLGLWALREVPKVSPLPEMLTWLAFTVSWISGVNKLSDGSWLIVPLEWGGLLMFVFLLYRLCRGLFRYGVRTLDPYHKTAEGDLIRNVAGNARRLYRKYVRDARIKDELKEVRELDPIENLETSPPDDEHIDLVCLWAAEFYTPSHNEKLVDSFAKLGWDKEKWTRGSGDPIAWLNGLRGDHQGGAWMNLGLLAPHDSKFFSRTQDRIVELPAGVKYATAGIHSLTPSLVCIVVCFVFEEHWSDKFNRALRTDHRTYATRTKHGWQYHMPRHQKIDRINEIRSHLSQLAATWFSKNLPGLFSSGLPEGELPTCEFITTRLVDPFVSRTVQEHSILGYSEIVGISQDHHVWGYGGIPSLKLRLPTGFARGPKLHSILAMREPTPCEDSPDKSSNTARLDRLQKLNMIIPNWLSAWAALPLLEGYTRHIREIRDSTTFRPRNRQNSLRVLENLGNHVSFSVDIAAVAAELSSDSKIPFPLSHVSGEFELANQEAQNGTSLTTFLTHMIRDRANWLQKTDAALRDQFTQYGSLIGATENVRVQKKLSLLTWVLVIFGLSALLVSIPALDPSPWIQSALSFFKGLMLS